MPLTFGGRQVSVRRILRGNVRDDARDTLVLEGSVPTQVALVRIVEVAAQLFAGQAVTEDTIRAHCNARLPNYKVPQMVALVRDLPRNSYGKVLKPALREMALRLGPQP